MTSRKLRRVLVGFAALVTGVSCPAARASEADDLCLADSIEGQVLERHARLLRAREHLAACAREPCEQAMRERCARWLDEATNATPRLRLRVEDDRSRPLPLAIVHLDGAIIDPSHAVEVDPGKHVLRADYAGRRGTAEVSSDHGEIVVALMIDLRAHVKERPTPNLVYGLSGAGGAFALAFGAFSASALVQAGHLTACEPYCPPQRKTPFDVAVAGSDISLGIGSAALLSALIFYLARPTLTREVRVSGGVLGTVPSASWTF